MKKSFAAVLVLLFLSCFAFAAAPKYSSRILLIPLDDRPPCLQFPVQMGLIADSEVVTPPRELLGRFTEFGKSDEIIDWLKTQDLKTFDAAIVSVDMLSYGGLVAMRVNRTDERAAMRRLAFVREMKKLAPKMKMYASSVIMRLAPTGTGDNESYRENLAKWAEISVDPNSKNETVELEKKIPAHALADYKAARARDLKINLETIRLVKDKVFDYLILSQDDAKPKGVHVADRERLIAETKRLKLQEKIAVQPGADEVSMLLLSRSLTDKYNFHPKIKAHYSSENTRNQVMPYEDRPLHQTVSFQIKAAGGIEVSPETDRHSTDLDFFVYASRLEKNGAKNFAEKILQGKNVVLADVDAKGDVQGADVDFIEYLTDPNFLNEQGEKQSSPQFGIFFFLSGYASWNTAGNTIGTALPQGILSGLANDSYFNVGVFRKNKKSVEKIDREAKNDFLNRAAIAHDWFLINRLIDDYAFHAVVRPKALQMIRANKWNALRLTGEQTKQVEEFCLRELQPFVNEIAADYRNVTKGKCEMSPITFDLPWNRTFEAEIDFKLECRRSADDKK
jgi:hypothetical protein